MKKKFLAVLLAGVLTVGTAGVPQLALTAQAESVESTESDDVSVVEYNKTSGDWTFDLYSDNTALIRSYNGTDTEIEIPDEIDGAKVTKLWQIQGVKNITKLTIPASITEANDFYWVFENLEEIVVDEDNTTFKSDNGIIYNHDITKLIFYPRGKKDETYVIPDSVTEIESQHGSEGFYSNTYLKKIKIGKGLALKDDWDNFVGLLALEEFAVDDENPNLTVVDGILFNHDKTKLIDCPKAKKLISYTIPNYVTKIGHLAFYKCKYLENIVIPANVKEIPCGIMIGAFSECPSLKTVTIEQGAEGWGACTFESCPMLESVTLPETVNNTDTLSSTFMNCDSIKEIIIPDGVKHLGSRTFNNCKSLETVTVPKSVISLTQTFDLCPSLKTIKYGGTMEEWKSLEYESGNFNTIKQLSEDVEIICTDGTINGKTETEDKPSGGSSSSGSTTTPEPTEYTDDENETGVTASADEGVLPDGAELVVTPVTSETSDSEFTYDISFKDTDGKEVQPKGNVTVKVPVPEKFKDAEKIYVYRAETDGTYTDMKAEVKDGFVVFTTNHFSKYIVTTEVLTKTETPAPETPKPTDTTPADTTTNPNTGVAVALIPAILAGAVVIVSAKKRK